MIFPNEASFSKTCPVIIALFFSLLALPSQAQIKLPQIIGNHMVVQRHQTVPIWGWAKKREKITVSFLHHTLTTRADRDGKWRVDLPEMNEGGPYEMLIYGKEDRIKLTDVMIGEVWICSGQSNMEWSVAASNDAEKEIRQANYPYIRLFDVPHKVAFSPQEDIEAGEWKECTPESIGAFSAVGYFFGRELHQKLDVPIGLISTNWGGTNIETWTSGKAITQVEGFENSIDHLSQERMEAMEREQKAKFDALLTGVDGTEGGLVDGKALWADLSLDDASWKEMNLPALWENAGLKGLDGVVWFRREIIVSGLIAQTGGELHLGPIDDSDITWVNGVKVGETHNQYNEDRIYTIPANVLRPGRNVITVRVEDYQGGGGIWGKKDQLKLVSGPSSIPLDGTWKYRISPVDLKLQLAPLGPNDAPTLLFNGMLNPIIPYAMQGAIWYQGESNASRAYQYQTLFPTMIQDWRNHWNRDFPFLFVQLANFMEAKDMPGESEWAELREAQLKTLNLHNTGMAVAIDIGVANDIHPRNKQDVGLRLALSAQKIAYGKDVVHSGPFYKSMYKTGGRIILEFENVGSGLMAKDKYGYLRGFSIAGDDKKFVWAKAIIEDGKIMVWSEEVPNPVAVRYAWADNPEDANLYNQEGLPASPFRTDMWKGITQKD
ncbi:MAG: 9-O-acetylesterase [Bacteroidetes bacterium]|nr:9-O-acetylesterase [Bacteroidota bacterium]